MIKCLSIIFCLALLSSCNGQKTVDLDKAASTATVSSEKIKSFLRERNFTILKEAETIVAFDIKKSLIEGTTNEYSNKSFLSDTLDLEKSTALLQFILDDTSYEWSANQAGDEFSLAHRYAIKSKSESFALLVDADGEKVRFGGFGGQSSTLSITNRFSSFLRDL